MSLLSAGLGSAGYAAGVKKPLTVPTAVKVPSGVVSEMSMSQVTLPFGFPLAAVNVSVSVGPPGG